MKRKFLSVLLILVLACSFSLVTAVPAGAQTLGDVSLKAEGNGIADWSVDNALLGSYSAKLIGGTQTGSDYAAIVMPMVGTMTLSEVTDFVYKCTFASAGNWGPHVCFYTHDPVDGETADITWSSGIAGGTPPTANQGLNTMTVTSATSQFFWWGDEDDSVLTQGQFPNVYTFGDFQTDPVFSTHVIDRIQIEYGWWSTGDASEPAYVDEIEINDVPYDLDWTHVSLIEVDDDREQFPGAPFQTIQGAIDCAISDDIISVAAGVYAESLVIATANISLEGAQADVDPTEEGARIALTEESTIDGGGMLGPGVHITATDVTFQGFTVTNFTCTPSSGVGAIWVEGDRAIIDNNIIYNIPSQLDPIEYPAGIGIDVAATDVEVTSNRVYDVGSIGIRVRSRYMEDGEGEPAALETGILVEDNTVYNTRNTGVLVAGHLEDVKIKVNEIYNSLPPTPYSLWILGTSSLGAPSGVAVEGNAISGGYGNVHLYGASNIVISGNTISGAIPHYSAPDTIKGKNIYIRAGSSNVSITNNDITGAEGHGVLILDTGLGAADVTMATTTTINFNNISGNTEYGVENTVVAAVVNAKYNWWDDVTGPEHATLNPGAQGNAVSENVTFSPWLYDTQENFVSDAPCYAGSVVLGNEATAVEVEPVSYAGGWNSFSTPVTLDGSADYISELLALTEGSDLSIVRAQRFDLASQEWVALVMGGELTGDDYQIKPGEGFFIQVEKKGSLPILCSTNPTSPPRTDLVAGWNLVGLSNFEGMTVENALYNVEYSVVLSASPPNAATWSVPPDEASKSMKLGEAYWLGMSQPGILFGHTTTPVAYDMTWKLNQN